MKENMDSEGAVKTAAKVTPKSADKIEAKPVKSAKAETKKPKVLPRHTHIEHHDDDSHTVRHSSQDGPEISYAKPDLDGVIDGLHAHLGESESENE